MNDEPDDRDENITPEDDFEALLMKAESGAALTPEEEDWLRRESEHRFRQRVTEDSAEGMRFGGQSLEDYLKDE